MGRREEELKVLHQYSVSKCAFERERLMNVIFESVSGRFEPKRERSTCPVVCSELVRSEEELRVFTQ